ncbi:hypothetical protein AURDEDRAFT_171575 [Auricularia subglabra TFB-10046 SS5]|nr:hypothetical protein AURDEDRAFT_171575 [Auricularia subglabra TFB-10046 SS5]
MSTDVPNGMLFVVAIQPVSSIDYDLTADVTEIPIIKCLAIVRKKGPATVPHTKLWGETDYMFHLVGRSKPPAGRGVLIVEREPKDIEKDAAVVGARNIPLSWKLKRRELYIDTLGIVAGKAANFLDPEEKDAKTLPTLMDGWEERFEPHIARAAHALHLEYGAARNSLQEAGVAVPPLWDAGDPYYDPEYRELKYISQDDKGQESSEDDDRAFTIADIAEKVYKHERCAPSRLKVYLYSLLRSSEWKWEDLHEPQDVADVINRLREVVLTHRPQPRRKLPLLPNWVRDKSGARLIPAPISPPALGVLIRMGYGLDVKEQIPGTPMASPSDGDSEECPLQAEETGQSRHVHFAE